MKVDAQLEKMLGLWVGAYREMYRASDAYNARLRLVQSERERGNWSMTLDHERSRVEETKRAEHSARAELFQVCVAERGELNYGYWQPTDSGLGQ
jgi:hypothetical protein